MKSISSLRSQSRLFYLLVIASLLIQMGFTSPVQAAADPAPQASIQSATFTSCADVTEIPQAECEVLAALYYSTDGENWTDHTDWLQTNTPCSWYGIGCDAGQVSSIGIDTNNLTGTIPTEISNLSNLNYLNLSINQLSGNIPPGFGNLSSLTELHLSYNQLTSSIPPELGNLVNLTMLAGCRRESFFYWLSGLSG
jgi:hypothetical protein